MNTRQWLFERHYWARRRIGRIGRAFVWRLPRVLVYWCAIRLIAHATQGQYGDTIVPELTAMDALQRWEKPWHARREWRRMKGVIDTTARVYPTLVNAALGGRPPLKACRVSATLCRRGDYWTDRGLACPYEGHDHPECQLSRGHDGLHDWQPLDGSDKRPTMDPERPPATVYAIPTPPPIGRRVRDPEGRAWLIVEGGIVDSEGSAARSERPIVTMRWDLLLSDCGPVTLVDLTPEELLDEEIYGPIGMRWGDPATPCPYSDLDVSCQLGVGHAGPHRGEHGDILGASSLVDGPINTTPQQSAAEPCNCGRPDQHRPTCNRYRRVSHRPTPYEARARKERGE